MTYWHYRQTWCSPYNVEQSDAFAIYHTNLNFISFCAYYIWPEFWIMSEICGTEHQNCSISWILAGCLSMFRLLHPWCAPNKWIQQTWKCSLLLVSVIPMVKQPHSFAILYARNFHDSSFNSHIWDFFYIVHHSSIPIAY